MLALGSGEHEFRDAKNTLRPTLRGVGRMDDQRYRADKPQPVIDAP